jgi:hypothetical protein
MPERLSRHVQTIANILVRNALIGRAKGRRIRVRRADTSKEAGMNRVAEDRTFGAIAGCVMMATLAAVALVIYAMLTLVHLVPAPPVAQDIVRLAF